MLWSFCILLVCQSIGEAIHAAAGLPIPGTMPGTGTTRLLALAPTAGAFSILAMSLAGLPRGTVLPICLARLAK